MPFPPYSTVPELSLITPWFGGNRDIIIANSPSFAILWSSATIPDFCLPTLSGIFLEHRHFQKSNFYRLTSRTPSFNTQLAKQEVFYRLKYHCTEYKAAKRHTAVYHTFVLWKGFRTSEEGMFWGLQVFLFVPVSKTCMWLHHLCILRSVSRHIMKS